jgi:hypothetical protein
MPDLIGTAVGAAEKAAGNLLSTVTSFIGNAQTTVTSLLSPQASAELSPSLFATGPDDKLITQDIYGIITDNPIDNVEKLLGSGTQNLISAFAAATGQIGNLTGLISASVAGVALDAATLAARVQGAITNFSGTFTSLDPATILSAATQSILTSNQFPNIATTIGGVLSTVSTTNLAGAQALINTVNAISGNPALASYMDIGASSALMSVVMQEAITLGIGGVVPALIASSMNDQVASNALKANTSYAVNKCDLATVNTISASLGAGYVLSQVPNAAAVMLANYRFPLGATTAQYTALYNTLITTLDSVDPLWWITTRHGHSISDLTPFVTISSDAKKLFHSQAAYQLEIIIAASYPTRGLVDLAKEQYPYMLVTRPNTQYITTNPSTVGVYTAVAA